MVYALGHNEVSFAREVIKFFTANQTGKNQIAEIKSTCLTNKLLAKRKDHETDLENGIYTIFDFSHYYFEKKLNRGQGMNMELLRKILRILVENSILTWLSP